MELKDLDHALEVLDKALMRKARDLGKTLAG